MNIETLLYVLLNAGVYTTICVILNVVFKTKFTAMFIVSSACGIAAGHFIIKHFLT